MRDQTKIPHAEEMRRAHMLKRNNKIPHVGKMRRAPLLTQRTRTAIGEREPLLSLAMLRRFITDIDTSNEPSRGMLAGYSLSIKDKRIIKKF
jgi:hypothetical protein